MHTLDFDMLDDLAFALSSQKISPEQAPELSAERIGPYLEWAQTMPSMNLTDSDFAKIRLGKLAALGSAIHTHRKSWTEPTNQNCGFLRITQEADGRENAWVAFGLGVQKAAVRMGFPNKTGAQLVAAMGEFHDNIVEHSENAGTGLLAFHAEYRRLEFVVLDTGVGLLRSLRRCAEYGGLTDHGSALELALTDGVSRYGSHANRGLGFRSLFVGIANLNACLRFRTGDHGLTIDGKSPALISAQTAQKIQMPGFLISVDCIAG